MHSFRVDHFSEAENEAELKDCLDAVEERKEQATLRLAAYQQRVVRFHNSRVRNRSFRVGDLVLRDAKFEGKDAPTGKLAHKWKGPFEITEEVRPGIYRLKTLDGRDISRTWNIVHLRKSYQ
ncbi:hypothetical protein Dimus_038027 [Dionaea muscipula]